MNRKIQTFEYLKDEKNFLDEIKSIFHNFLKSICGEKKKNNGQKLLNYMMQYSVTRFYGINKQEVQRYCTLFKCYQYQYLAHINK